VSCEFRERKKSGEQLLGDAKIISTVDMIGAWTVNTLIFPVKEKGILKPI